MMVLVGLGEDRKWEDPRVTMNTGFFKTSLLRELALLISLEEYKNLSLNSQNSHKVTHGRGQLIPAFSLYGEMGGPVRTIAGSAQGSLEYAVVNNKETLFQTR